MKIIYLRVSNDELSYDDQLPEILDTFKLAKSDCVIFEEKISAYKELAQSKRSEFIKLKTLVEAEKVTDIYVYSLERLERNIIRMFEFFFFCEANGCRIHGVLQPSLELEFDNNPVGTFSRYQQVLIFGLLGENESYMTSQRTKKAVEVTKSGTIISYKGNKWGDKYRDLQGKRVDLPIKTIESIRRRVLFLLGNGVIAKGIIEDIAKRFKVKISAMTVSRIKNN